MSWDKTRDGVQMTNTAAQTMINEAASCMTELMVYKKLVAPLSPKEA